MNFNKFHYFISIILLLASIIYSQNIQAQKKKKDKSPYVFTIENELKATSVKNQYRSGTCWSFGTCSFIEAELIRMNKGEHDLSEMFFVRYTYPKKAINYVRLHGKTVFGAGGLLHDVMNIIREYGIVPEEVYDGKNYGSKKHEHGELDAVLKGMLDGVIKKKNGKLTPRWLKAFEAVLDVYLGKVPENFIYNNKTYTPQSFTKEALGFNPDDYFQLTSYSHHPFYSKFNLEIPDNWSNGYFYNLPIDEFAQVFDYALKNGYSIAWDGDVSEKEFSHKQGVAIVPLKDWEDKTKEEREEIFKKVVPEKEITQEMRQISFDNYTTTDNHLMHIVGIARDRKGTKYYLTKNSWGTDSNALMGKLYLSESYVRLKTIAIMVHKDAIPLDIAEKLVIKN